MSDIHIVLQGKGGVGKSVVAAFVAQQQREAGRTVQCYDTDPVNATFSGYSALEAEYINIMDQDGDDINPRKFDELIESIAASEADSVVIDNGAASFVALTSYLRSNDVVLLLEEMGHRVFIHTVITAGQALKDTVIGFKTIAESFADTKAKLVVWLNEFWGNIEMDGKTFEQMKVYKDNVKTIHAVVTIPKLKKDTFGQDMADMLSQKLTFDEAINGSQFQIMAKQRLKMVKKQLFENMAVAL